MADRKIADLERAAAGGDETARAKLARALQRTQTSLVNYLRNMIGQEVYIEGARMNYLGVLEDVPEGEYGKPAAIVFKENTCVRVASWGRDGPDASRAFIWPGLGIVSWESVGQISLAPDGWYARAIGD